LPTFVHNADTIIRGRRIDFIADDLTSKYDAYVDVFVGNSPKYSYVRAYENTVVEIVEKKQISPYASSGFYGFMNSHLYLEYYNKLAEKDGELYIADVMQSMIQSNKQVFMNPLGGEQETIVLGSPQEYGIEIARQTLGAK